MRRFLCNFHRYCRIYAISFACRSIGTCSIVMQHLPENVYTTPNPCKLRATCVLASAFFLFLCAKRWTRVNWCTAYLIRNIDNTGSFSQFYLLFRSAFLLPRQPMIFKANILYDKSLSAQILSATIHVWRQRMRMLFFFHWDCHLDLRALQWI